MFLYMIIVKQNITIIMINLTTYKCIRTKQLGSCIQLDHK